MRMLNVIFESSLFSAVFSISRKFGSATAYVKISSENLLAWLNLVV